MRTDTVLRITTVVLWGQLLLGIGVAFFAFGDIHSGALGMEYARGMQKEFEKVRDTPEVRNAPAIRGYPFARLIESRFDAARDRSRAGFLAFIAGLGASAFAGLLLWLLARVPR
jgi:hypothetical protein